MEGVGERAWKRCRGINGIDGGALGVMEFGSIGFDHRGSFSRHCCQGINVAAHLEAKLSGLYFLLYVLLYACTVVEHTLF